MLSTGETYSYDANGNTPALHRTQCGASVTQRVEGGQTYTQTFDAENRLISVAVGGQTTQFIYDGDGNLVKKINPNGSKTLYVGGIYEVDKTSGGSVTRTVTYYPVAGAMRINNTLYYILKDHLGSASVVTDASGNILGENRYYPFGETRLSTGSILTDKLYTGQHEMAGLGIYHYQARFYSPKLGRFLSADTIVPNFANPQSLNRYSYVYNSPLNYTDPTGHDAYWCQTASCQASYYIAKNDGFFAAYGVEVDRNMTSREKLAIMVAISRTGKKIAGTRGKDETAAEAFTAIYNPITFTQTDTFDIGCVTGVNTVICADFTFENFQSDVNNVVHELGHVFNNVLGGTFADYGWTYAQPDIRNAILRPRTNGIDWQQNTLYDPTSTYATGVEMSGDMFVAWVFDAWNTDPRNTGLVDQARNTLNTNMANWLNR